MADNTKISWTDATLNYCNGCSIESPGCSNCYAMKQAHRFPVRQGLTVQSKGGMVWTGEVRDTPKALEQAMRWKRARKIFWNAHGDLFHPKVPTEWIDRQMAVCAMTPQHTHQILTKRSGRMREYFTDYGWRDRVSEVINAWPADEIYNGNEFSGDFDVLMADWKPLPNVWLGVSAEDQRRWDERVADLESTPSAVRFVSMEPMLEPIRIDDALELDWIIVGAESGSKARWMDHDWIRPVRDQAAMKGIALWVKQLSGERGRAIKDLEQFPLDLRIQQFPEPHHV